MDNEKQATHFRLVWPVWIKIFVIHEISDGGICLAGNFEHRICLGLLN